MESTEHFSFKSGALTIGLLGPLRLSKSVKKKCYMLAIKETGLNQYIYDTVILG